jgi:transglutaminase-like putative cysteine protease
VIVPGFGSKAVIDFSTAVEGAVSLDPFVAIQNRLTKSDPVPVMRVTSPKPMYLRLVSLPVFDQRGWLPAPDQQGSPIGPQGEVFSTAPSSAVPVEVGVEVLNDLNLNYLPAPFPADRIAAPGLEVTYDSETGSAITGPISRGTTYAVSGWYVAEGADRLRAIPDQPGFGEPPQGVVDRYLATPDTLPREVEQLARQWTAGADNVFDRARLIEEHLRTFEYRDDAAFGSGPTAILEFLREQRAGFCQQFAASMAAMLRTLDIPARVVVGFTNATSVNGSWTVTSDRMHAWVEVLFNGVGWMPFEPTPFRTNPIEVVYDRGTDEPCPGPDCPDGGSTGGAPANQRGRGQQGLIDPTPALPGSRGRDPNVPEPFEGPTGPSARTKLLLAAVAAALLVLLLVPLGRWAGRRLRLRRAADEPRRLILLTYEQFTERIAGVGLGRGPGETLEEYRRRVLETGHLADGHLDRLTRIATSAAYSGRDPDPGAARDATQAAGTALAEIRRSVGPVRWVTGLYRRT